MVMLPSELVSSGWWMDEWIELSRLLFRSLAPANAALFLKVADHLHGQVAGEEANRDGIDRNKQQTCDYEQDCLQDALLSPILWILRNGRMTRSYRPIVASAMMKVQNRNTAALTTTL